MDLILFDLIDFILSLISLSIFIYVYIKRHELLLWLIFILIIMLHQLYILLLNFIEILINFGLILETCGIIIIFLSGLEEYYKIFMQTKKKHNISFIFLSTFLIMDLLIFGITIFFIILLFLTIFIFLYIFFKEKTPTNLFICLSLFCLLVSAIFPGRYVIQIFLTILIATGIVALIEMKLIEAENIIKEEVIKLKEIDQLRKGLISNVSHELKTPLMSILATSEYLLNFKQEKPNEEMLELLKMIERGGKRLRNLVESLLDISRIEYENLELMKKNTMISEIINNCIRDMMILIEKRDLSITLDIKDDLNLEIDKMRIKQVISNLLSNSI